MRSSHKGLTTPSILSNYTTALAAVKPYVSLRYQTRRRHGQRWSLGRRSGGAAVAIFTTAILATILMGLDIKHAMMG
jgi:hypothetical protein